MRVPVHEVEYEQLVADPSRFRGVLQFLDVDPDAGELRTTLRKWNQRPYRDAIVNFDEVRAALRGTEFEHLLARGA
jgi:hypothetical protein